MLSVLCGVDFKESSDKFAQTKSFKNLTSCKYQQSVANSSHFKEIARLMSSKDSEPFEALKSYLGQAIDKFRNDAGQLEELVELGVSCLQLFLQNNWLGPLEDYMREFAKADQEQRLAFYLGAANAEVTHLTWFLAACLQLDQEVRL